MMTKLVERLRRDLRSRRMKRFRKTMALGADWRILDVGGTPELWSGDLGDLNVTFLNLGVIADQIRCAAGARTVVSGDICRLPDIAAEFDLVFSNSVLEHVGSARRQDQYAAAVRRGKAYWVQVPAPCFPVEAHCRYLFWWLLPASLRRRRIRAWRRNDNPFLGRQMAGTRPIDARRLRQLFPDGKISTERMLGMVKSYYVWRH